MSESFPHFRPSTQRDERLKSVEKHFLNSHISVESEKCDKREASVDGEETFRFESKSEENSNKAGSSVAVQRTGDIRAGAPEVAQKVAGSFNPKVPFIDERLRLCLFSRATTSSERINRPGIETSSADGRD